jgi:hypothetical protein
VVSHHCLSYRPLQALGLPPGRLVGLFSSGRAPSGRAEQTLCLLSALNAKL